MSEPRPGRPQGEGATGASRPRVIGIGQELAGDDGVGPAVLRLLGAEAQLEAELWVVSDASQLLSLLDGSAPVLLVDAVVGAGLPGRVIALELEELGRRGLRPVSTHGLGVVEAVALARALDMPSARSRVELVGVSVDPPVRGACSLSAAVAAAIPLAAQEVLARIRHPARQPPPPAGTGAGQPEPQGA